MDMYSILRIQYVHITPDSIVQYTPKYSVNYLVANISGYCIGIVNSYFWNKQFTFKSYKSNFKEFPRFVLIFIISYLLNMLFVIAAVEYFFMNENMAYIIGMIIYTIINFLGNKFITFKK